MLITFVTLFPEMFESIFSSSILSRAIKKGKLKVNFINIRDYARDKHRSVDDKPYGGGVGMLLRVDVVERAIDAAKCNNETCLRRQAMKQCNNEKIILLDPAGNKFSQSKARKLSGYDHLILVCGHYEGTDYRIHHFVNDSISIGNYILTGGEIPSMVIADAVTRLLPNVLSKKEATENESFSKKSVLEYPQYTRPLKYKNYSVPKTLLSGNHKEINLFRNKQSEMRKPG